MSQTLEESAKRAQQGDQRALEELVAQIQGKIYGLALRTLCHPEDARDATQEILLRVVTHLATFRGESRFIKVRIARPHSGVCHGEIRVQADRPLEKRDGGSVIAFDKHGLMAQAVGFEGFK